MTSTAPAWMSGSARTLERLRDTAARRRLLFFNIGAGVQSTALALMAALEQIERPDAMVFADTGWEPAAVYDNLAWIERELAQPIDVPLIRVSAGNVRDDALRTDGPYLSLPLHVLHPGGAHSVIRRACTRDRKVRPIERLVRASLGARIHADGKVGRVPAGRRATQIIGFSHDEPTRAERINDDAPAYAEYDTPLITMGLTRQGCQHLLAKHGRPDVAKSACVGCPLSGNARWRAMKAGQPAEWADACEFDERIRHGHPGFPTPLRGQAFVHRSRVPLADANLERITRGEWRERQGELDLTAAPRLDSTIDGRLVDLDDFDDDPPGCSPFGCRRGEIPTARAAEAAA